MGYNLLIHGVYGGYNPLTNLLLTSWDIQATHDFGASFRRPIFQDENPGTFNEKRIHGKLRYPPPKLPPPQ